MNTKQILEMIEKRTGLQKDLIAKRKEIFACQKCLKNARDKVLLIVHSIDQNNTNFANSFFDVDRTLLIDPSQINQNLELQIKNINSGYGFEACSDDHRKAVSDLMYKVQEVETINQIIGRVK